MAKYHFFVGKGGVGKSTTSALTAVNISDSGEKTLLVSMDPAHNQRDLFEADFSRKPVNISENLAVIEVDEDYWIKKYLKKTQDHIQDTYTYQSAFNLQDHLNILRYSPGIEEYALILAYEDIINKYDGAVRHVILDMPPTALTLKFFTLPFVSLLWLNELKKIRTKIKEKKEIMSKIQFGKREFDTDKVMSQLDRLIIRNSVLNSHFTGDDTFVNLVMNYDRLSFAEAKRLKKRLENINIHIERMVVNKTGQEDYSRELSHEFSIDRILLFPMNDRHISGIDNMRKYLKRYDIHF